MRGWVLCSKERAVMRGGSEAQRSVDTGDYFKFCGFGTLRITVMSFLWVTYSTHNYGLF